METLSIVVSVIAVFIVVCIASLAFGLLVARCMSKVKPKRFPGYPPYCNHPLSDEEIIHRFGLNTDFKVKGSFPDAKKDTKTTSD